MRWHQQKSLRLFSDIDAVACYRTQAGDTAPVAIDVPIGPTPDSPFRS